MAKTNEGAAGSDGVTFEAIETQGVEAFLGQIQSELQRRCYVPQRPRRQEIPKEGSNKFRTLSIPSIRDRVVQGALKLIMEPVFGAPGSLALPAGENPAPARDEAIPPGIEPWACGGNDMS
jgi:RNA-directed DNA polymerase